MGALIRFIRRFILKLKETFLNTHFSIKPIQYTFITPMSFSQINDIIGEKAGFVRNLKDYTDMMGGYCKGNRITLFKVSFSARFVTTMRPFHGYMFRENDKTIISGSFRFSLSTKIITCAWMLNDAIRLIGKLADPYPGNFAGHLISMLLLPILLFQTVWRDKSQQQGVIDFMKDELSASEHS